nr:hypothetical protein BaRGS_027280 [Batillaria attramentaria]
MIRYTENTHFLAARPRRSFRRHRQKNKPCYGLYQQKLFAADFVEKTMFKSIMIRLLRGAPGETQNISSILTEEVLEVDRQLLAIARSNMEISDILTFDLRDMEPQFMILATDGLWDCFSSEEAVDYIKERLSEPHFGAKSLVMQAYYRGSVDNITVMVVNFQKKRASHVRKWSQ